jgi:hypothetical protein
MPGDVHMDHVDEDCMEDLYSDCKRMYLDDPANVLSSDNITGILQRFTNIWTKPPDGDLLTMIMSNFGFGSIEDVSLDALLEKQDMFMSPIQIYLSAFTDYTMHKDFPTLSNDVHVAFQIMQAGFEMFRAMGSASMIYQNLGASTTEPASAWLRHYTRANVDSDQASFKDLVDYLNRKICMMHLSRWGTNLMRQVFISENGHNQCTFAWTFHEKIDKFCWSMTAPDQLIGFELATKGQALLRNAIEWLENQGSTSQMNTLKRDRNVFSYRNGVYFAAYDYFVPYTEPIVYPREAQDMAGLQPVAAKFFDIMFDYRPDQRGAHACGIPTPNVDRIFDHQEFDIQTQRTMWILLGRFLYDLNVRDRWEVTLSIYGIRGTGKSKIINLISMFYDSEDIGVVSADMRKVQGLEGMDTKFIMTAPDVKSGFWLDRTLFQTMSDGGEVMTQGMYKSSKKVTWTVPMVFAYNENPWPDDPQGSVNRRQATIRYSKIVAARDVDTTLDQKIAENIANILLKANRMYLWACEEYKEQGFWDWCSAHFTETRRHMESDNNPWALFLESGQVAYGNPKDFYCSMLDVTKMCKTYVHEMCAVSAKKALSGNESSFGAAFAERGLKTVKVTAADNLFYPSDLRSPEHGNPAPKNLKGVTVVFGMDLIPQTVL